MITMTAQEVAAAVLTAQFHWPQIDPATTTIRTLSILGSELEAAAAGYDDLDDLNEQGFALAEEGFVGVTKGPFKLDEAAAEHNELLAELINKEVTIIIDGPYVLAYAAPANLLLVGLT